MSCASGCNMIWSPLVCAQASVRVAAIKRDLNAFMVRISLVQAPRLADGPRAHAVGLRVAGEFLLGRIEGQLARKLPGDVSGVAGDVSLAGGVGIGTGGGAGLDRIQEIAHMVARVGAGLGDGLV